MDKSERKAAKKAKKAARPWFKKKRFIFPAILVLFIVLVANAPKSDDSTSTASTSSSPTPSAKPAVFGGQCEKVLANIASVKSTVSPVVNGQTGIVVGVNIDDNYVLNTTIGDLGDLSTNGADKFGSKNNFTLFNNWFFAVERMNANAASSGVRESFDSNDMGPYNLVSAYMDFKDTSKQIQKRCSAK